MSLIDKIQQLINGTKERGDKPVPQPKVDSDNFITFKMMSHYRDLQEDYDEMLGIERKLKKVKDQIKGKQDELHTQFMKAVADKLSVEPGPFALEKDTKKHRFSPPYKTWLEDAIGESSIDAKLVAHKKKNNIPEEDTFIRVIKVRQPVESRVD